MRKHPRMVSSKATTKNGIFCYKSNRFNDIIIMSHRPPLGDLQHFPQRQRAVPISSRKDWRLRVEGQEKSRMRWLVCIRWLCLKAKTQGTWLRCAVNKKKAYWVIDTIIRWSKNSLIEDTKKEKKEIHHFIYWSECHSETQDGLLALTSRDRIEEYTIINSERALTWDPPKTWANPKPKSKHFLSVHKPID